MSNSKLDLRRNVLVNGLVTFVASMARKLAGQDKYNLFFIWYKIENGKNVAEGVDLMQK